MQAASSGSSGICSSRRGCRSQSLRLGRCAVGQQHVGMHRRSSSRLQGKAQYKAVDLQDGVLRQQAQQQQPTSRVDSPVLDQQNVAVPPPSNMQAQVMLVPKKGASTALLRQKPAAEDPLGRFLLKCKLAWNLFFPPQQHEEGTAAAATPRLSPKDLGKQRLQMILVADRCGLSPNSLVEMKKNTLAALADCMDLEDLQDAHLRFTMTREGGTTYSMAVPILRPGPYADDGSVVGQDAKRAAAAAAAAGLAGTVMAAAAGGDDGADWETDPDDEYAAACYDDVVDGGGHGADLPVIDAVFSNVTDTAATPDKTPAAMAQKQSLVVDGSDTGNEDEPALAAAAAEGPANAEAVSSDDSDTECFKEQFKELLVDELVHDVGELVQHTPTAGPDDSSTAAGGSVQAGAIEDAGDEATTSGSRSCSSTPVVVFSDVDLREVAAKEVQRLVEGDQMGEQ